MQVKEYIRLIGDEISGVNAYRYAAALSGYHRIPLSSGYDAAAEYCVQQLRCGGVDSRILSIPMERGSRLWSQKGFDNWTCKKGTLRLTAPVQELLCDYEKCPTSLIQRSGSASLSDVPIVMLDRGSDMAAYDDLDLANTVVFIPEVSYSSYTWAVKQKGALGMITDCIPETFTKNRTLLPDARSFFSFSWSDGETPFFGFVLSPRQGDALRKLCRETEESWQNNGSFRYPTCDIAVEAETSPGCVHIAEAYIPGTTEEEIVVTAHLCHPMPSANDNASGCAGAMEIMVVLSRLIQNGSLPKPVRGIRMLLVPEVSGTFAYLATHEASLSRIKAAINLDMIGRRQEGRSGLLGIWATPDALPSFIIDLMGYIRSLSDREAPSFNIDGHVTPFHSRIMEYNGGSDHYVYCDPSVGIPCITFMQWMDQHYHTSEDVAEHLDSEMLHKSASMAACWLYALANPDPADLPHAFAHMRQRFLETLHAATERNPVRGINFGEFCAYEASVFRLAAKDALRFYGTDVAPLVERQKAMLTALGAMEADGHESPLLPAQQDVRIPRRLLRGPLTFVGNVLSAEAEGEIAALAKTYPGLYGYHSINHFILFRVDGKRTVSEIARLVGLEGRYYSEGYVSGYLDILAKEGLVSFETASL